MTERNLTIPEPAADRVPARQPSALDRLFASIQARPRLSTGLLLAPGMLWMLLFLLIPLALIVYFSFFTQEGTRLLPEYTLENYQRFFRSDVYLGVMLQTIRTWLIVLGLTLVIGYPVAYFISMMVENPRNQTLLLLLAIIPFWTNSGDRSPPRRRRGRCSPCARGPPAPDARQRERSRHAPHRRRPDFP